jgi:osmotically-inducible protein OsmY
MHEVWSAAVARRRGQRALPVAFALAAVLMLAPPRASCDESHELRDAAIRNAVESQYLGDPTVPFNSIEVDVARGIVTLRGEVRTLLARERAVTLARAIKGVRAVVDELQLAPEPRGDLALQRDVERALGADPSSGSYDVRVEAASGVVTLNGKVDSWQERQIAERVAAGVKGVRQIRNELEFVMRARRPDGEIRAEIRKRLHWDARVDDDLIEIGVDDGVVSLTGIVGSALEKARARELAWVQGVRRVDSDALQVQWWARDQMRREKYAFRTDDQLKQAILDAFRYDPRVRAFHPEVDVEGGIATLSGVVENLEARHAAEQDAHDTVGVVMVRNQLRVKPGAPPNDAEIGSGVRSALERDPLVDRFAIDVASDHGAVTLRGSVETLFEKQRAETVASGVRGVVEVRNDLQLAARLALRSDLRIEKDIEDALYWSPFVDSDQVHVSVENGIATLTGTVDSWADRSWAAEDAREGGALVVRNLIGVRSPKKPVARSGASGR